MEREDMLEDDRYYTNSERLKHDDDVQEIVSTWIRQFTMKELTDKLDEFGVLVSPIYTIEDIFNEPQYKVRENIVEVEHTRLVKVKIPGIIPKCWKQSGT